MFVPAQSTQYSDCFDGDLRLFGGETINKGNVQICFNNAWGSVCHDSWDNNDATVACAQLGFVSGKLNNDSD